MFTLRDLPMLFWRMLTASPASEYRASLELCRERNAELLAKCCALAIENEALKEHLQRVIGERDAFDVELRAKETAYAN